MDRKYNIGYHDRILGLMLGGAIGDALGAPVEHMWYGSFPWVEDYQITARFFEGEYSGDTAMALCLAESLLRIDGCNIEDQLDNYLKWHFSGYLGTRSYAKGEGKQTKEILNEYFDYKQGLLKYKPWEKDNSYKLMDGNGSLMRIGPVPAFYYNNAEQALDAAKMSSISTHNTKLCIDSCVYMAGLIWGALHGVNKSELLKPYYSPVKDFYKNNNLLDPMRQIIEGNYIYMDEKEVIDTHGTGFAFVLNTLRVVLWGFYNFDTFESGLEGIINLGGDSNTNACVYGYLAGAYYGLGSIPERWISKLMDKGLIIDFGEKLSNHIQGESYKGVKTNFDIKYDINRFIKAQNDKYDKALFDVRVGHKTPKWRMLYIFPSISTFLEGGQAKTFAISCIQEAKDYYKNTLLKERLIEISSALLNLDTNDAVEIFGEIDALELFSCMTLFSLTQPENKVFKEVLNKYFDGKLNDETLRVYEYMKTYEDNEKEDNEEKLETKNDWLAELPLGIGKYFQPGLINTGNALIASINNKETLPTPTNLQLDPCKGDVLESKSNKKSMVNSSEQLPKIIVPSPETILEKAKVEDGKTKKGNNDYTMFGYLRKINLNKAEKLAELNIKTLDLNEIRELGNAQTEFLSKFKGSEINLSGLDEITDAQSYFLSQFEGDKLDLGGLTKINDTQAYYLSKFKGSTLILNGLRKISAAQSRCLSCFGGDFLNLGKVENLSVIQAEDLSEFGGKKLYLDRATGITSGGLKKFLYFGGSELHICGIKIVNGALTCHEKLLTDGQMELIMAYNGKRVVLENLESLSDNQFRKLINSARRSKNTEYRLPNLVLSPAQYDKFKNYELSNIQITLQSTLIKKNFNDQLDELKTEE